jgi:hypothetical protein
VYLAAGTADLDLVPPLGELARPAIAAISPGDDPAVHRCLFIWLHRVFRFAHRSAMNASGANRPQRQSAMPRKIARACISTNHRGAIALASQYVTA